MTEHVPGSGPTPRHLKAMLQRAASSRRAVHQEFKGGGYAFIAYAREDAAAAAAVVETLEARGICIKWDRNLRGGENFRKRISELIGSASAVIVLWSAHSIASDFVIDEAEAGKVRDRLVTCRLGALDEFGIPFGFRQLHCVDAADTDAVMDALAVLGVGPMPAD